MAEPVRPVLVIGFGNTLRSDDGVGWLLAGEVEATPEPGLEVRQVQQLTPELAADVARARLVIFLDARIQASSGRDVGPRDSQNRVSIETVIPTGDAPLMHGLTPGHLLALACALYGKSVPARVVSILVDSLDLGDKLSPQVSRAMPAALAATWGLIRSPEISGVIASAEFSF